ncbi:hypothetical protein LEP3755_43240 [Leptolyngbya sp. NIES-3755]|nr:hypothetical protein LEP3755_43240 [Leptolyngbya sp. NIES-3755]
MSQSNEWQGIIRGILLAILLAIATAAIAFLLAAALQMLRIPPTANWAYNIGLLLNLTVYFIGLTQLLYIIPLLIVFWRQRRFALLKGLTIGAVIIALLNFGCFLYVSSLFGV